ncbi:MAG: hypothetical protein WB729_17030 [Candidatus Sulfotelmatobacter sp.]
MGSNARAQTDASQIALQHPGWILVPGALVRPDCVHRIPNGAGPRIENGRDTGDVVLHGNIVAHYDPCPEDATIRFKQETSESSAITNVTGNGLVEDSYWDDTSLGSSDNLDFVYNYLTVPSKPTKNGAVILLYNAVQDSTGGYVFAPVLQYGKNLGEGGNYWSIVSYFVTPTDTYLDPATKVNKGDMLELSTQLFAKSGGSYQWEVALQDLTTNGFSDLTPYTSGLHFNVAISGALSVANLTSCSEFPASKAVFTGTVVDHGFPSLNPLSPKWVGATYVYGGPACGFSVTAGNKTTLKY